MTSKPFFKKHPKLSIVLFNLVLLIFIFIVFEICLRLFAPNWLKYRMRYLNTGTGYGYGTDANWKITYQNGKFYSFTPNSTFKIYNEEYENTVHINNLGGRSTTPDERADTSGLIPFTGDSFIMGVGVEDTENVVSIIKKRTNYNFLNLGVGGSSFPIQRALISNRYHNLGKPRVVIYGVFMGNDFDDIIKEYAKRKDTTSHKDSSTAQNGFIWNVNSFINHNSFLRKLYSLQYIKQKILNLQNKDRDKARDHTDPIFLILNHTDTAYVNLAKNLMNKEVELLSKEPYKPIVILIPDRYQINESIRKNMSDYYNIDEKNLQPRLPNDILKEALIKYNIPYIDATECVGSHLKDGELYYTQDNHFTKLGQKIFSDCITDTLKSIIQSIK
jgi:hypothetical protein